MTTSELIEIVSHETGLPKATVAVILKKSNEVALRTLKSGEPVVLTGFGAFYVAKLKKATLFGVTVPKRDKIRFRISKRKEHE